MIVRFFKTGLSRGEAPVNYLFSDLDHQGVQRGQPPELLQGTPKLTIDLINGISRTHKYASGCLAFRPDEQPTRAEIFKIIERFKAVVAPGLSSDQFNSLFVLHHEKPQPKTGQAGFHVHFVFPMTLLSGQTSTGKDLTGKRWNPHPPGKRTIETMALFTEVINNEYGWAKVMEQPLRVGVDSFWKKANQAGHANKANLLRKELVRAIKNGTVGNRHELCQYMDEALGLTITRQNNTSVSVRLPGSAKAMRLKGPMFEVATDYMTLRAAASKHHGTEQVSVLQHLDAKGRLEALLRERAKEIVGSRASTESKTITRREQRNGKNRPTEHGREGVEPTRRTDVRKPELPIAASGLGRSVFPASQRQWGHDHSWNDQAGHGRSQKAENPVQHAQHESGCPDQGKRWQRRVGGWGTPTSSTDIDQKIWALALELNDCELGSPEGNAITQQMAILVGERDRLANNPKPKLRPS